LELTLKEIADLVGGNVVGDDATVIKGVNSLEAAGKSEISFFTHQRYADLLAKSEASAVIVSKEEAIFGGPQVVTSNPGAAYAKVAALFVPSLPKFKGISESAIVLDGCDIGENVSIYPTVYVGKDVVIGEDVVLFPGVYVGDRVRIGKETVIYPNVTILQDCVLGNNVTIHSGTVVGSDGFGFVRDGAVSVKIPQIGIVQIDDNVEIGANNCIDRAAFGKTWIKRGVKTDNLVQIAHNVVIGEDTVIVAQAGISGSVDIGSEVIIGGQVGIRDHVQVGDRVMIASQSGVAKSIPSGEIASGSPTIPHRLWLKSVGLFSKLPKINDRLRHLEKRMKALEKSLSLNKE
jgi:UDP-3-O-[3-hydroxymyristoyl] glucosamine N-acyltransferase